MAQGRRGGAWVYVVVVVARLLLVAALALLVRRDQVLLTADALTVRRLGRVRAVGWDGGVERDELEAVLAELVGQR